MFCPNCGTKTEEGSIFCPECGQRFPSVPYPGETNNVSEDKTARIDPDVIPETIGFSGENSDLEPTQVIFNGYGQTTDYGKTTAGYGQTTDYGKTTGGYGQTTDYGKTTAGYGQTTDYGKTTGGYGQTTDYGKTTAGYGQTTDYGKTTGGYGQTTDYGQTTGYNPNGGYNPNSGYNPTGGYNPNGGYNPGGGYAGGNAGYNPNGGYAGGNAGYNPGGGYAGGNAGYNPGGGYAGGNTGSDIGGKPEKQKKVKPAKNGGNNEKKTPVIPIVIGVAAVAVIAVILVLVFVKPFGHKNKNQEIAEITTEAVESEKETETEETTEEATTEEETTKASEESGVSDGYAKAASDIPTAALQQMSNKAKSDFEEYIKGTWVLVKNADGRQEKLESMKYMNTLFLTAKKAGTKPENYCVLVFEQNITNTNTSGTVYYYTMYSDIKVNSDGSCSVDLNNTIVPQSDRTASGSGYQYTGEYVVLPGDNYYYYDGYSSIDDLKAHFEEIYGADYNIEDNL